jgi:hypothetical protein
MPDQYLLPHRLFESRIRLHSKLPGKSQADFTERQEQVV